MVKYLSALVFLAVVAGGSYVCGHRSGERDLPERVEQSYRDGFEDGGLWEHGLIEHCERDQPKDVRGCVEALYGSGEPELKAVRETYPDFKVRYE